MTNRLVTRTIFAFLIGLPLSSAPVYAGEKRSCEVEVRKCKSVRGTCIWVGVPLDVDCDSQCQMDVMRKIQDRFKVGVISGAAPKKRNGCVGYRPDIGGTEKGAKCLADHLGLAFDPEGCNVSGWAYNVIVQ